MKCVFVLYKDFGPHDGGLEPLGVFTTVEKAKRYAEKQAVARGQEILAWVKDKWGWRATVSGCDYCIDIEKLDPPLKSAEQ